jgi:CheY-like chemotaxis protein
VQTIVALGGICHVAETAENAVKILQAIEAAGGALSDVIVDHRCICDYDATLSPLLSGPRKVRRIYLVNPEERPLRPLTGFDAWLIRPLREQTLSDVLRGLMSGVDSAHVSAPLSELTARKSNVTAVSGSLNVLVGEDDFVNATLLRAVLQKAGHRVGQVGDFDALRREVAADTGADIDLIITDLGMPGGEGGSVIRYIRMIEQLKQRPRCPVLVLTGDLRVSAKADALSSGADLVLQKPVNPERLLNEIRSLMTDYRTHLRL